MILKNCRLIAELTEGYEVKGLADIVLEGANIKDILPAGGTYENEETIDVAGKTVIPGLFNLHDHLYFRQPDFNALHLADEMDHLLYSISYAQDLLSYGYTTVRDCGNVYGAAIKLRDAINNGLVEGPNVLACGYSYCPSFRGAANLDIYKAVNRIEDIRPTVREQLTAGADFIKLITTDARLSIKSNADAVCKFNFTPEEMKEWAEAAAYEGSYITCHANGTEAIKTVIEVGARTIEHGAYLDDECIELILKKGNKTHLVPTLAVTYDAWKMDIPVAWDCCQYGGEGAKKAYDAGVLVGFGTDDWQPSFTGMPAKEFIARKEFGFSNIDLLKQATINSAMIIEQNDVRGTIKVGKIADLVVVNGNPDEDIMVMNDLPAYVFKSGKRFVKA